ncbi:RNA polymerase II mediator complex subunit [Saxophila tyrrhenica]|uniref:Mediator of RNA polymerase II transcription subunit 17 n=1 Tax=Saxophila tyrrhenica TaxID=1690608 RepID=A0AAV9PD58_9PEZI|nr:RNA polymerase II mediator complex subunit [Saxophila tyrrhenica]
MASTAAESLSIQPWARTGGEDGALMDILARANFERGHFRDISEATLQEELATDGALELSESEDDDEEEEEEEEKEVEAGAVSSDGVRPTTREELYKAKYEMLGKVRAAEQEILMALDFVSLLVSKDVPKQGASTMSPFLKQAVPMGTLGTDLWQRMPADKAREAQDELLATEVKMEGLQQSADNLLGAANRLRDNVQKETEYWNQVLSISEEGWNVCRIPGQPNRLAVRFGFSESSPEFSRRGMAALISTSDGKITLERGVGSKPKSLRVVMRKGSRIVGTSKLPDSPDADDTTLAARIRYARDSLYDEELYHEMLRESRTLTSLGVHMSGSEIHFNRQAELDDSFDISMDLIALDEAPDIQYDPSSPQDRLAQMTVLAARLLLSQAHRDRLKKRSGVPPPMSDKRNDSKPLLPILRPLLSLVMHHRTVERLNAYLDLVASIVKTAKCELETQHARFELPQDAQSSTTESLISMLMQTWTSHVQLTVKNCEGGDESMTSTIETSLANNSSFGSAITLASSDADKHHFDDHEGLIGAADAKVASNLARGLLAVTDKHWVFEETEALLVKDTAAGEKSEAIWVALDSESKTLTLQSLKKKFFWTLGGEQSQESFAEAAAELLGPRKGR